MRQIVLDTETTGLAISQGHRIIEIACIEMVNRRFSGREYHRFLNPEREIDEGAEAVHGISSADLENQPRFSDIADEFLEFIKPFWVCAEKWIVIDNINILSAELKWSKLG